jgi:hypothetical protein
VIAWRSLYQRILNQRILKAGRVRHAAPKDEQLKDERNRFLAFAFAAADLLIEVDAASICAPSMSTTSRSTAATAICRS